MNRGYAAYLRSEHWQNLRLKKLAMNRGMCVICFQFKSPDEMNVHHLSYGPDLKRVPMRQLKALCVDCHQTFHKVVEKLYGEEADTYPTPRSRWHFLRTKAMMMHRNRTYLPLDLDWELRLKHEKP